MNNPIGQPYSRVYLERGEPTLDSKRVRLRLSSYVLEAFDGNVVALRSYIRTRSGLALAGNSSSDAVAAFLDTGPVADVLDAITYIHDALHAGSDRQHWLQHVEKSFREENMSFTVDRAGGVHPFVDEEFQQNKRSAIAILEAEHLKAVRVAVADAFRHMDGSDPDRKAAIRSIFEAVEILVRQIAPGAPRLNKNVVRDVLTKACLSSFAGHAVEKKVLEALFLSRGYWVDALHDFRHGQPDATPAKPSDALAIYAISSGCAFIRLLAPYALRAPTTGG